MKTCRVCNESKDDDQFYAGKSKCKACIIIYGKLYYRANKPKVLAREKARYAMEQSPMMEIIKQLKDILELRAEIQRAIRPETSSQVAVADAHYRNYIGLLEFDTDRMLAEMKKYLEEIQQTPARKTIGGQLNYTQLMENNQ